MLAHSPQNAISHRQKNRLRLITSGKNSYQQSRQLDQNPWESLRLQLLPSQKPGPVRTVRDYTGPMMGNKRFGSQLSVPLAALLCLLHLSASAAEIYKWVDENGDVHYADNPQDPDSEKLLLRPAPPADAGAIEHRRQRDKLLDIFAEERAEKKKVAAAERVAAQKRKRNCERAEKRQSQYDNVGYIYDVDESGNRRILSDEEHVKVRQQARDAVAHWCG